MKAQGAHAGGVQVCAHAGGVQVCAQFGTGKLKAVHGSFGK